MAKLTRKSDVQSSECAVCIPDGAKLMLREISPTLQKGATYRDPVEFKNGVTIRLQELGEGRSVEYSVGRSPLHEFRLEVTLSGQVETAPWRL
jgi:hypothetical protein